MTWPDVEGGVRDYLRADSAVSALVGTRVFFGVPKQAKFPLITVRRIGGPQDPSEAPLDLPLVQIDVWGEGNNKAQAHAVCAAVRDALDAIRSATSLNAGVVAYGANVENVTWFPDPADDRPRYVLTAQVTARAA